MATYLKRRIDAAISDDLELKVRRTVEDIIADLEQALAKATA